jgi:hypothetical protein
MGVLKNQTTRHRRSLAARTLAGRAPGCALRLGDRGASAEHASIFWTGGRWEVRDLGSTNGTWVDGRRLEPGERVVLRAGSELLLGGGGERWILTDDLPPVASARCLDGGEVRVAEDGLLVLPSANDPVASLFEDPSGRWVLETDGPARPAIDQEEVVAGATWLLSVPPLTSSGLVQTTLNLRATSFRLDEITLRLDVSRDEEYVALSIVHNREVTRLPARAHLQSLLALARVRLQDRDDASLTEGERGWVYTDGLIAMLKSDPQRLAVDIFRVRQQLASAGVLNAGGIVERRALTRQLRLGTDRVEVCSL